MTHWQQRARRLRWAMLSVGVLLTIGGALCLVAPYLEWGTGIVWSPLTPFITLLDPAEADYYKLDLALYVGLFLLTQWMFLRPRKNWRIQLAQQGRSMKTSIIAAAVMAMLLTIGFIATLLELPNWWPVTFDDDDTTFLGAFWPIWAAMVLMWVVWAVVFFIYWRQGDRYTRSDKMIRGLLAGSVLEVFVSTSVYAWNPRQEDCHCVRGSYTGLVFGGTVLVWCFGPGVVLLFMRERYRAGSRHCLRCNYDLRGTLAAARLTCPECGEPVLRETNGD